MSIIASAAATTQPTTADFVRELLIFLAATLPGLGVVWATRAYRPGSVAGRLRVPPAEPVWPLPVAIAVAIAGMLAISVAYAAVVGVRQAAGGQSANPPAATQSAGVNVDVGQPTPTDLAVLSVVLPVCALAAGLGFLVLLKPASPRWLGLSANRLPRGLGLGLLAAVFGVPATYLVSVLTESAYQAVGYQHPTEHELLKSMKEAASPALKWAAIAAAVVVAPVVEEFIFRGLLQTTLATWLVRLGRRPQPAGFPIDPGGYPGGPAYGFPAAAAGSVLPPSVTRPLSPPADHPSAEFAVPPPLPVTPFDPQARDDPGRQSERDDETRPRWVQAWVAIAVTSLLFALVHPLWTAPIIFFLSLVLGYVYERTGNLWAAVGLHAVFNASSTALYLLNPT